MAQEVTMRAQTPRLYIFHAYVFFLHWRINLFDKSICLDSRSVYFNGFDNETCDGNEKLVKSSKKKYPPAICSEMELRKLNE